MTLNRILIFYDDEKNLGNRNKIQGEPDCLENVNIRMKPILDKCWVVCTGRSHTHSKEAGQASEKWEESTGVLGVETPKGYCVG